VPPILQMLSAPRGSQPEGLILSRCAAASQLKQVGAVKTAPTRHALGTTLAPEVCWPSLLIRFYGNALSPQNRGEHWLALPSVLR
jgi:hypothetical protein